jgi:tryptophan-rich sensory protein
MIKSWMVIAAVTFVLSLGGGLITPNDFKWFKRLQRPRWLNFFVPIIPLIWTVVFICGAWSAYVVWESDPGSTRTWILMGLYVLLEVVTVAYQPLSLRLRSLKVGTIVGGIGATLGIILALVVLSVSIWASVLLLPYVIWSPIGTYATWELMRLNPESA